MRERESKKERERERQKKHKHTANEQNILQITVEIDDEYSFITQRDDLNAWPCCNATEMLRATLLTKASATKNAMTPAVSILRLTRMRMLFLCAQLVEPAICVWQSEKKSERAGLSTARSKTKTKTRATRQRIRRPATKHTRACTRQTVRQQCAQWPRSQQQRGTKYARNANTTKRKKLLGCARQR